MRRTAASACSMPTVKLGSKEFDVDSEEIDANTCGVSAADCIAFAARMRTGEISRVKRLKLVSVCLCFSAEFACAFSSACVRPTSVLQWGNQVGVEGAKAIASALQQGAEDTTLHVRVPGKPVESTGLDCVVRGGLPPECPISCNTPACVLTRQPKNCAECAKDISSFLFMHESAHVQFIFIIIITFLLSCILVRKPNRFTVRQLSTVSARSHTSLTSPPIPMMPTILREPAGIRRQHQQSRGKPRIKFK